ncbi:MAG: hypothetical protein IJU23_03095, partial [Proteobacteria bacterium]|nr:hypothetical protein [Pseudomonadota bacterium]
MFVDLSLNSKKYCGTQPLCVRCFNRNEVVVDSWNSVFVEVCCALYKKNPIRFEKSTRTETFSRVILPSAQNMRKPALFVAGHYVETDFEDYEIIDWIKRLIDRLGIAAEAIVISYQLENLHADGSDKMVRPTSSPEMAQNSQIETNDLFKTISSEFNAWNGILKFGSVSSFAEFIYTRPESLSVYSGFGHIESTRNVVSYQFNSWVDILERILILLAQSQPDQVLLCLKKHCGSVASVFQTKDGLKKPILLFDQNYIDLFAFENDIPATVECICRLVRTLKIKSEECVIHFVVDDNLVRSTKDDTNAESQHDSSEDSVAAAEKTEQEETSDSKIELSDSEIDADSEELDEETVPDSVDV